MAASLLLGVGGVAIWDLIEGRSLSPGQQGSVTLLQTSSTLQTTGPSTGQTSTPPPAGYIFVASLAALSGKSSAYFNHPTAGLSMLINLNGQWKAFSATCTHAPCTVQYGGAQIQCPCHGGTFNPSNGSVTSGPPPTPLPEYGVITQGSGLYVSTSRIN